MREGQMKNGRPCIIFEGDEIAQVAYRPPYYCDNDGTPLVYVQFYDSLNRPTIKAYCRKCKRNWALAQTEENYEKHRLKHWEQLVKERANNTCEMADDKCQGPMHAHHIIPKHLDPSKKYDIENGLCLCEAHHKMIHHYM